MIVFLGYLFLVCFGFVLGTLFGWVKAHEAVAEECKRLGRFYVRKEVFICTAVEQYDPKSENTEAS